MPWVRRWLSPGRTSIFLSTVFHQIGTTTRVVVAGGILVQPAWAKVRFASKQAAFTQGYSAYKSQQYEIAVPALEFASGRGVMRAKFFLAKIYSDNSGATWTESGDSGSVTQENLMGVIHDGTDWVAVGTAAPGAANEGQGAGPRDSDGGRAAPVRCSDP